MVSDFITNDFPSGCVKPSALSFSIPAKWVNKVKWKKMKKK